MNGSAGCSAWPRRSAGSWLGASCSSSFLISRTYSTSPAPKWHGFSRRLTRSSVWADPPTTRAMGRFYPKFSKAFSELLAGGSGRTVAVIGHSRPDGDCIGSPGALARVLAAGGSKAVCVNTDPVPRRLAYIARGMDFKGTDDALLMPADAAAGFVDCGGHVRGACGALHRRRAPHRRGHGGSALRGHHDRHGAIPVQFDLPAHLRPRRRARRPRRVAFGGGLRAL